MAHYYTIARPYARAAFHEATNNDQLQPWLKALQVLSLTVEDEQVRHLIKNPKVSETQLMDLFCDVLLSTLPDTPEALCNEWQRFVTLLCYDKRLSLLPDIAELYRRLLAEQKGIVEIEVLSAEPLQEEQQVQLQASLEKRFSSQVSIDYKLDSSLIGGALIRSGNWVMDGSVRRKLAQLGESILG